MDNIRYIALLDVDEFLIPRDPDQKSLLELLKTIDDPKINSFSFRNAFMVQSNASDHRNLEGISKDCSALIVQFTNQLSSTENQFLFTQQHTAQAEVSKVHGRSKMVAKSKQLIKLSNHIFLTALRDTVERVVEPKEAVMFHYRNPSFPGTYDNEDRTAMKYSDQLFGNVDAVCGKVFDDGICAINE